MRDIDEKLTALQKENFNLKLRLYFLEERNASTASTPSGGQKTPEEHSLFKQNIDLKVENEELKKELQGKQELLIQAAKVVELMEESQKKTQDQSVAKVADLEHKIHYLEVRKMKQKYSKSNSE